ncbi:hypothetical protein RUND412_001636 [Rhizina undulata]
MPPANSPTDSPSHTLLPPFLPEAIPEAFRSRNFLGLLAHMSTRDSAEDSRIRNAGPLREPSQSRAPRQPEGTPNSGGSMDRARRLTIGYMTQPQATPPTDHRSQAYGPRIPSVRPGQRQSLYDWAPSTLPDDDFERRSLPPLADPFAGDDEPRSLAMAMGVQTHSPAPLMGSVSRIRPSREPATPRSYSDVFGNIPVAEPALRTTFMQGFRQSSPRRIQRSRPQWYGMSWERERERDNHSREFDASRSRLDSSDGLSHHRFRSQRTRNESSRSESTPPAASNDLQEAIKYLAALRSCNSPTESLNLAIKAGFNREDDWIELMGGESRWADFIFDTRFLHISQTSWLNVGGVFLGTQATPAELISGGSWPSASSASLPSNTTAAVASAYEGRGSNATVSNCGRWPVNWPVKVTISSIDYSQMRLTGAMEAFTDRGTICEETGNSITTYLEGEIIDFKTHSFETLSFQSSIKDDANNWRRLQPFAQMSNDQIVKSLVSKKFMKMLMTEWVFMRWKERCFITPRTPEDVEHLTIGGFYFLSLRRCDGTIQGFYYDPTGIPDQELRLKPSIRTFPAYEFR